MVLSRVPAIFLILLVVPCAADEFQFAINQRLLGMTNESGTPSAEQRFGDGIYSIRPEITLSGEAEVFDYLLSYVPNYSRYFRASGRDGWDHFFRANAVLNPSPSDRVSFSIQVSDLNATRTEIYTTDAGATEFVGSNVGDILQVLGDLSLIHSFSSRSRGSANFSYQEFKYSSVGNTNNRSLGMTLQFVRALSPRLTLGANFSTNYRTFELESGDAFRFQTTVNPNAIVQFQFNSHWQFSLNVGPSAIFTQEAGYSGFTTTRFGTGLSEGPGGPDYYNYQGCVPSPDRPGYLLFGQSFCVSGPGTASVLAGKLEELTFVDLLPGEPTVPDSTDDLTYFMNVGLVREGPTGGAELFYIRREDASQGQSSTSVLDQVVAAADGQFSEKWLWEMNAGWYQRVSTEPRTLFYLTAADSGLQSDPEGGSTYPIAEAGGVYVERTDQLIETSQVWMESTLIRRISPKANLVLRFRYERWLDLFLRTGPAPLYDNVIGELRVDYYFDPYIF